MDSTNKRSPKSVAPPVYRPQPVPKVLQRKVSPIQHTHAGQTPRRPVAPPVYRPAAKPVIAQAKMAANSQLGKHPISQPAYRPQAKPNAPRRNAVVQRYTLVDIQNMGGMGKLSENGNYFVANAARGSIYVETNANQPQASEDAKKPQQTYNTRQYKEYKPVGKFYADCLHTAEEVNEGGGELEFKNSLRSRVVGTKKNFGLFGKDIKSNIRLARSHHKKFDAAADPEVGQAYVIVNKKWKGRGRKDPTLGKYPFHAAAVVARDGKDRITLEVFAGEDEAEQRDIDGKYSMYEAGVTATPGRTFHEAHSSTGDFAAGPYTLVIKPK